MQEGEKKLGGEGKGFRKAVFVGMVKRFGVVKNMGEREKEKTGCRGKWG